MTDIPAPIVRKSSKFGRFAAIVAVFVVVGPPIGGLMIVLFIFAQKFFGVQAPELTLDSFLFLMGMSYFTGFFFALASGVIVAVAATWGRRNGIFLPVLGAAVASVVVIIGILLFVGPTSPAREEPHMVMLFFFPICLVASVICWSLTRKLARLP